MMQKMHVGVQYDGHANSGCSAHLNSLLCEKMQVNLNYFIKLLHLGCFRVLVPILNYIIMCV